jgi:hypothetical protein
LKLTISRFEIEKSDDYKLAYKVVCSSQGDAMRRVRIINVHCFRWALGMQICNWTWATATIDGRKILCWASGPHLLAHVAAASPGLCHSPLLPGLCVLAAARLKEKKVHITSLNFRKSPFFITELQNQAKHLPQLLKPFILPLWPCYKQFWRRFCLFLFYLFRLNLWKIIVNHRKIIKQKIQFCWTPHE